MAMVLGSERIAYLTLYHDEAGREVEGPAASGEDLPEGAAGKVVFGSRPVTGAVRLAVTEGWTEESSDVDNGLRLICAVLWVKAGLVRANGDPLGALSPEDFQGLDGWMQDRVMQWLAELGAVSLGQTNGDRSGESEPSSSS